MAIDMHELDFTGGRCHAAPSNADFDALVDWFQMNALPAPPIPAQLRAGIERHTPSVWATINLDPWRLVDNDRALTALEASGHLDHVVVGNVCRNSEHSRIAYQLAHRGIGVVASCLWRYDHLEHDAEVIDQTFFAIGALLDNLDHDLESRWQERPGLLVEVHGRSVRWWRPDHERGPFQHGPDAEACWESLARAVCVDRPSWRVRVLDQLPRV
jgi:hypothetical protein